VRASHLEDLVSLGTFTAGAARFLDAAVTSGLNVLVSGGTQAGNASNRQYSFMPYGNAKITRRIGSWM
jgi:pilus assembly protein CpaF